MVWSARRLSHSVIYLKLEGIQADSLRKEKSNTASLLKRVIAFALFNWMIKVVKGSKSNVFGKVR